LIEPDEDRGSKILQLLGLQLRSITSQQHTVYVLPMDVFYVF